MVTAVLRHCRQRLALLSQRGCQLQPLELWCYSIPVVDSLSTPRQHLALLPFSCNQSQHWALSAWHLCRSSRIAVSVWQSVAPLCISVAPLQFVLQYIFVNAISIKINHSIKLAWAAPRFLVHLVEFLVQRSDAAASSGVKSCATFLLPWLSNL